MEPPARIELATSSLPMRCYTTKPRWRRPCHQAFRYNRFASSQNERPQGEMAPRERFELPRDGPTRFPVARTTRLCDLGSVIAEPRFSFNHHPPKGPRLGREAKGLKGATSNRRPLPRPSRLKRRFPPVNPRPSRGSLEMLWTPPRATLVRPRFRSEWPTSRWPVRFEPTSRCRTVSTPS